MKSALNTFVKYIENQEYLSMELLIKLLDSYNWDEKGLVELTWSSNTDSSFIDGHLSLSIINQQGTIEKRDNRFLKGNYYYLKIELVLFHKDIKSGDIPSNTLYKAFTSKFNTHNLYTEEDIKQAIEIVKNMEHFLQTGGQSLKATPKLKEETIETFEKLLNKRSITPAKVIRW